MEATLTPDYDALMHAAIASASNHQKWLESKFEGVKVVSNTAVGTVGQDFVESLCNALILEHDFPMSAGKRLSQNPWDIRILDKTFELKTATEDTSGCFQFNHIRYHRPYDAVLCIGIAPNDIMFDCWSKADIVTGKAGRLNSMEAGANASYKLTKRRITLHPIAEFEQRVRALIAQL